MDLTKRYLLAYNAVQAVGWTVILGKTIFVALNTGPTAVYSSIFTELAVFQTLAILEIVHCLVGLVNAPLLTTLMQVTSRLVIVWPVTTMIPLSSQSTGVLIYVLAWSITEVIRYSCYGCAILQRTPYFLLYARYSLFVMLYPLGVAGEITTILAGLSQVKRERILHYDMPNSLNFAFNYYYALVVFMVLYFPFFPQLYFHMFRQRKRILGPSKDQSKEE